MLGAKKNQNDIKVKEPLENFYLILQEKHNSEFIH
jgi:hypothetical protein